MPIVAITGHRPEDIKNPEWVYDSLKQVLKEVNPEKLYQGMAAGTDLMSAQLAIILGIPFVAARPWKTHTSRIEDREIYQFVLDKADEVINVSESNYYSGPQLYHARNEYMVDKADIVIAIWNGSKKGGTAACVKYALKQGKPLIQLNPMTEEISEIVETPALF